MRKYCVITLRSVFVQGIRALDTLSPYIYYELLQYKDLGMNDTVRTFNYGFEFQSPKYADTCQVICQAKSRNVQIL